MLLNRALPLPLALEEAEDGMLADPRVSLDACREPERSKPLPPTGPLGLGGGPDADADGGRDTTEDTDMVRPGPLPDERRLVGLPTLLPLAADEDGPCDPAAADRPQKLLPMLPELVRGLTAAVMEDAALAVRTRGLVFSLDGLLATLSRIMLVLFERPPGLLGNPSLEVVVTLLLRTRAGLPGMPPEPRPRPLLRVRGLLGTLPEGGRPPREADGFPRLS